MNLLSWILFGVIVGLVANAIDPAENQGGLPGAILLGISGSLVGGILANFFFGAGDLGFDITSFIVAVAGSLMILFGTRMLRIT